MSSAIQQKVFTTPAGSPQTPHRIRSFVCRNGRITDAQVEAREALWPTVGLSIDNGKLDYATVFGREAPCFLEIGFGMGVSLVAAAKAQPEHDFIGIETHLPGIGALCQGIQTHQLHNLKIMYGDAVVALEQCIPDGSLTGVQIFFPDPWPKRKHHPRRIIQPAFVSLLVSKLKEGGAIHLATDWEHYARQMMVVMSNESRLANTAGVNTFAERSVHRPILSKFEQRAIREKRNIWDLQFVKVDNAPLLT